MPKSKRPRKKRKRTMTIEDGGTFEMRGGSRIRGRYRELYVEGPTGDEIVVGRVLAGLYDSREVQRVASEFLIQITIAATRIYCTRQLGLTGWAVPDEYDIPPMTRLVRRIRAEVEKVVDLDKILAESTPAVDPVTVILPPNLVVALARIERDVESA